MDIPSIDLTIVVAVIGGLSGVLSALITAKLTSGAVKKQAERSAIINAAYLTTQIAPALRAYAATCMSVSYDDGEIEGRPAGEDGFCEPTVTAPTFKPSGFDVDWKALPPVLMADVLTFPEKAQDATNGLDEREYWDPPEHLDFFADRKRIYAKLGLQAMQLADQLHAHVKLATSEQATRMRSLLSERFGVLDAERERLETIRAKHHAEWVASGSGIPPMPTA